MCLKLLLKLNATPYASKVEASNSEIDSGIQLLQTLYSFAVYHVPTPVGKGAYMKVEKHLTLDDRLCIHIGNDIKVEDLY